MKENKQLKEMLLDEQRRSVQDNLILSGISERDNDIAEPTIQNHQLKLSQEPVHGISFSRVDKSCPIIAWFEHFKQKELVKSRGKALTGTNFWMNNQFLKKINERRRKLTPILREYRIKNHKVSLVVDLLYTDGQLYRDSEITLVMVVLKCLSSLSVCFTF